MSMTFEDVFDVEAADAESIGCEVHQDPECLCDVKITEVVPIGTTEPVPVDLDEFLDWAVIQAERAELQDFMEAHDLDTAFLDEQAISYHSGTGLDLVQNQRKAFTALRSRGLRYDQMAAVLNISVEQMLREHFDPEYDHINVEAYLAADDLVFDHELNDSQIADAVGLSPSQVERIRVGAGFKGLSKAGHPSEVKAEVKRLYETTDMYEREIAEQTGISRGTIASWVRDERWERTAGGEQRGTKGWGPEKKQQAQCLYEDGAKLDAIAEETGVPKGTIKYWVHVGNWSRPGVA